MSVDTLTPDGGPVALPLFGGSDQPIDYTTISGADEVAVAYQSGPGIELVGYDLAGNQLFADVGPGSGDLTSILNFTLAPAGGVGLVMAWDTESAAAGGLAFSGAYRLVDASGKAQASGQQGDAYGFTAFAAANGAHLE
jgi:hypothetical protein